MVSRNLVVWLLEVSLSNRSSVLLLLLLNGIPVCNLDESSSDLLTRQPVHSELTKPVILFQSKCCQAGGGQGCSQPWK